MGVEVAIVVGLVLAALVLVTALNRKGRIRARAKWGELNATLDADDPQPPRTAKAVIEGSRASSGSAIATDTTGNGALILRTEVQGDLVATSSLPADTSAEKKTT